MPRRSTPDPLLSCALVALLAACNPSGEPPEEGPRWEAAIDTIGDTVVVRTVSGQTWEHDRQLVSEVSIGVLDGDDRYQFGQLRAIAVNDRGEIYAFDSHVPALRVYGPEGTWLRDIGREGEGPGEYKRPDSGLSVLPDGRVALRDPGNGRITLYTPEGEYDGFYRIAGSFNTSQPMIADTSGGLVTFVVTNLGASVFEWERGHARYNLDGTIDTLTMPDLEFEEATVSAQRENSSSMSHVPFTAEQVTTYSPFGYYVVGTSDDFSFDLLRPEGVLRVTRAYDPVPVERGEAAAERERMTDNFKQNYPGWKWNGPPIPDVKPAYLEFYAAEDGRIWVHVPAPSERYMDAEEQRAEEERLGRAVNPYRAPVLFDVFEPTGAYLGQVTTPEGFSLRPRPIFRGDTVWAVVTDEYDVQRLNRFRMEAITTD